MKKIGAWVGTGSTQFRVWAPSCEQLHLKVGRSSAVKYQMKRDENGYFELEIREDLTSREYVFVLPGGEERPDPASFYQPRGVHQPSLVVDHRSFAWNDQSWKGVPVPELIIYELHPGTFSVPGTLAGVQAKIGHFLELGVNAIELMPLSQFPGTRNWGYDGVHPFSVQNSYGSVNDLKSLVNACHGAGIAVILDLVYNHLGPEGNYLGQFGPYFTDRYKTPWGWAVNFDGPDSDEVRSYFFQNALYWLEQFHIDGLRLDAVHSMFDFGAKHFLEALHDQVRQFSRHAERNCFVIAESDLNDPRLISPVDRGGYALEAQWNDDFHHCLHTLVSGERSGYYEDFGQLAQYAKCLSEGFVYAGDYSRHRKKRFGRSARHCPPHQFVVCTQNHDQVGNRMLGERLSALVSGAAQKLLAAQLLTGPFTPLLFMGEEWAESAPFLYFVSHQDEQLVQAVREGRKKEFAAFCWKGEPPDPQSEETFRRSRLHWDLLSSGAHQAMLEWYKALIQWRKNRVEVLAAGFSSLRSEVVREKPLLTLYRKASSLEVFSVSNFSEVQQEWEVEGELLSGTWRMVLNSTDTWGNNPDQAVPLMPRPQGNLSYVLAPHAFLLWEKES